MSAFAKLPETETEPFLAPKRKAVTDTSLPAGVSHIWVLEGAPDSSIHLLIRQEYKDALVAILTWMKKINERAEYEDSSSLRDETKAVDVDSDPSRFYLKNTKQSSKATANEDKDGLTGRVARAERIGEDNENSSEDDDPVPIPLTHTPAEGGDSSDPLNEDDVVSPTETDSIPLKRTTLLSSLDKFPNPFKDFGSISIDNGLVITGSLGIGKSYFLFLVLHLRRAKNLPTLYAKGAIKQPNKNTTAPNQTIDMFKTVALTWVTKLRQLLELSREKPSWGVRVYEGTRQTLALARIVISSPRPNSGPSYDISTKEPSLWSRIIPY
ncbi:hypothetical protein BDP27DRAFT_1406429 [Rhodocollybia butyracea]|uniref:Uncharacterized protein n=1 Tax=Rhodocollybia butyracea TaxID=206335 RepID=A0A9P5PAG3_9AGAR|nr:hypothetical protein BDP27DRAFT_1406429 [Rhodocollybia butyracea]